MPTARDLLDQADALMRRNRSPIVDDIPVLTDSVMPAAQARVLRSRASPPPRVPPPKAPAADTIPALTERVAPSAARDEVAVEGEPSDWLQLDGGEPSVIGDAPDSIAIVPDVAKPPPAEDVDIFAADPDTKQLVTAARAEEQFEDELNPVAGSAPALSPTAAALAAEFVAAPISIDAVPPIDEAPEFADADELTVDLQPLPETEPDADDVPAKPATNGVPEPVSALPGAAPDPVPFTQQSPAQDDARWESIAEEIRTQVLQRIDLFTDTGLREQLGARLQPIVDRASADLVATINQRVGELLRAYVAEAIEREIENWRKGA
jgi:hypothetical protein